MKTKLISKLRPGLFGRGFLTLVVLGVFSLGVLCPLEARGAISDFGSRAPIITEDSASGYYLLELPDEVLGQTRSGLEDLRLYSGEEEIPYAVLRSQDWQQTPKNERATLLNQGTDQAGNLVFELNISPDKTVSQIIFLTPDQNFIRQVQVEGSHDRQDWVTLAAGRTIFDLTAEQKTRHLEINMPPTDFPYLRVTVFPDGQGVFRPEGVELGYADRFAVPPVLKERPHVQRLEEGQDGIREYILDLYQPHLPSRELEIKTGEENFNRNVEIYAGANQTDWQPIGAGEIYAYRLAKLPAQQLVLKFQTNLRYLKLRIHNQDNSPLRIEDIIIRGTNPAVVFPAGQDKEYFLYWNSSQVKAPVYDLEKFKDKLDYSQMPKATLGPSEENQAYRYQDTRPWTERNPWLLQAILVVAVLALLIIIVGSIRKISSDKQ